MIPEDWPLVGDEDVSRMEGKSACTICIVRTPDMVVVDVSLSIEYMDGSR